MKILSSLTLIAIVLTSFASPSAALAADAVTVRFQNKTTVEVQITLRGPATYTFTLDAGKTSQPMLSGSYAYSYKACNETKTGHFKVGSSGASLVLPRCKNGENSGKGCHRSYPTLCIPAPPPDLDCKDIPYRRFPVIGKDPHHFDVDRDGIGCES